jgi:hypothetical protein
MMESIDVALLSLFLSLFLVLVLVLVLVQVQLKRGRGGGRKLQKVGSAHQENLIAPAGCTTVELL